MRFFKRVRLHGKICSFMNDYRDHKIKTKGEAIDRLLVLLEEAERLKDESFALIQRLIMII